MSFIIWIGNQFSFSSVSTDSNGYFDKENSRLRLNVYIDCESIVDVHIQLCIDSIKKIASVTGMSPLQEIKNEFISTVKYVISSYLGFFWKILWKNDESSGIIKSAGLTFKTNPSAQWDDETFTYSNGNNCENWLRASGKMNIHKKWFRSSGILSGQICGGINVKDFIVNFSLRRKRKATIVSISGMIPTYLGRDYNMVLEELNFYSISNEFKETISNILAPLTAEFPI